MSSTEAARLPAQVHFVVTQGDILANWWALATALADLVLAVLAIQLLRSTRAAAVTAPTGARLLGLVGGLAIAASTAFAWIASVGSPQARGLAVGFEWPAALWMSDLLRLAVVLGVAVVVAATRDRAAWSGGAVGLLLTQGVAPGVWLDPSWQDGFNVLATGFWLALVGQLLLVMAVVVAVAVAGPEGREPVGAPVRTG